MTHVGTEKLTPRARYDYATGLAAGEQTLPLPVQVKAGQTVQLGNNFSNYQAYQGYPQYVHGGLDFCVPAGTPVVAVCGGRLEYRGLRNKTGGGACAYVHEVDGQGRLTGRHWAFDHLEPASITQAMRQRAARNECVAAGDKLGEVMAWGTVDQSDGKPFDHTHFDMRVHFGRNDGRAYNLQRAFGLPDAIKPTLRSIHIAHHDTHELFTGRTPRVRGNVDVVVEAFDLANAARCQTDGSLTATAKAAPFKLGIHDASVAIKAHGSDTPVFATTLGCFDSWPSRNWEPDWQFMRQYTAEHVYIKALAAQGRVLTGQGDYDKRRGFLAVTHTRDGGLDATSAWDTTAHPNGLYDITVTIHDDAGNETRKTRQVRIDNR